MSSSMTKMERPPNTAATVTACSIIPGSEKQGPASFGFRLSSQHMGIDLNKELEWLKERSMEDKRLKEKFPKINGEPTWLLRHIEVLQEEYAKSGWEYEIEIPADCQHRLHPSIIGSYLIFTREKKGRKGKFTKEYIPVPLSNGALWEFWKPVDDDARPSTAGRLAYLPPLGPGESSIGTGLLDRDLDRYLNSGDDDEDFGEYTIDGFGVLPEDRPRRRVISNSSSGSGGEVSAYSGSSFDTAPTSTQNRSRSLSIMGSSANYAPDRALRSIRRASENFVPSNSTNNSSSIHNGLMSNGMPVPGSIRKAKYGYRSDSEDLEDDLDDVNDNEDEEEQGDLLSTTKPIYGKTGRCRAIQNSDSDEEEEEDEEEGEDYPIYIPKSIKAKRGLSDVIGVFDDEDDELAPANSRYRKKGRSGAFVEISDEDDESVSSELDRKPKAKPIHGKKARQVVEILESDNEAGSDEVEDEFESENEGQDEDDEENMLEDDEWFDESGYCKFCDLHQHECDCIRDDDNYTVDRGEDDDDYKN
ncbi:hypothetical protein DL95DRAFT_407433 [Leptodontidium sp. 2 PMI_412]|nr:hypothetical protein DL95DRAFT_407433 [Leptodontidium sp. 2 PMI_412]